MAITSSGDRPVCSETLFYIGAELSPVTDRYLKDRAGPDRAGLKRLADRARQLFNFFAGAFPGINVDGEGPVGGNRLNKPSPGQVSGYPCPEP